MSGLNIAYHVRPRYTPGSPAQVDRVLARRLAEQENDAYLEAVSWSEHPGYDKAVVQGLAWIVWTSWEAHGSYYRKCLLTGQTTSDKIKKGQPISPVPNPGESK